MVELVHPCRAFHPGQFQEEFEVYPVFGRVDVPRFQYCIVCFEYGEKRRSVFLSERGSDNVLQNLEFCYVSISCLGRLPRGL